MTTQQLYEFERCVKLLNSQYQRTKSKNDPRLEGIIREQRDIVETLAMLQNLADEENEKIKKLEKTNRKHEVVIEKILYLCCQIDLEFFIKVISSFEFAEKRNDEFTKNAVYGAIKKLYQF